MDKKILLSHGSGGRLTHNLISNIFIKYFDNSILKEQTDSAILNIDSKQIAFTTDSYVINPIFFPGGDIGKLAVCGTINDLAVSGADPLYISVSFIIEEGLEIETLEKIVISIANEAKKAGVKIVTGDTKVVDKGECDKIFINTSGIGVLNEKNKDISFGKNIKAGDKILINGSIGDHGMAVLSARNELNLKANIDSDCASIYNLMKTATDTSKNIKFARDATRGGLGTLLSELADKASLNITIEESQIPVKESVAGLCEILGFDPIYVANEGKLVVVVDKNDAEKVLQAWQKKPLGKNSAIIGEVTDTKKAEVILNTAVGGTRIIEMLSGAQLPRIC